MRLKRGLYYSVINLEKSITGTDERTGTHDAIWR